MHDMAVKIRKMTDEQICQYIEQCKNADSDHKEQVKSVDDFLKIAENVKGIGHRTVQRLYDLAKSAGYLNTESE